MCAHTRQPSTVWVCISVLLCCNSACTTTTFITTRLKRSFRESKEIKRNNITLDKAKVLWFWKCEVVGEEKAEREHGAQKARPINHKMHFWVPRASVAGSLPITRVNAIKWSIKFVERVKLTQMTSPNSNLMAQIRWRRLGWSLIFVALVQLQPRVVMMFAFWSCAHRINILEILRQ